MGGIGLLAAAAAATAEGTADTPAGLEAILDEAGDVPEDGLAPVFDGQRPDAIGIRDAFVTLAVTPRYPKRALRRDQDGQVTLAFDISKHGRAEHIRVVEAVPRGVFEDEAVDAMQYWAFSPARLALCGTAEQSASQTIVFEHDADPQIRLLPLVVNEVPQPPQPMEYGTLREYRQRQEAARQATPVSDPRAFYPVHRVEPDYPLEALERNKEGMVAVMFLIEKDGSVSNVDVVDTVKGVYFQRPALQAIRQWRFKPRTRDGIPVESVGCHEFVFHVDEYERSGKLARQREDNNIRVFKGE